MNLLRNLSSAIRRATSASHMLDRAASNPDLMTRAPTLSSLVNASSSIGTTTSVGATTTVKDNPSALQADTVVTSPVVYSQQSEPVAILKAGQQSANWSNPFVSHALPAILQLSRHLSESSLSQSAMRTQLGLEVRLYRERWPALVVSGKIRDASYLLCTYLDENASDAARAGSLVLYDGERSLLVEFHDDAWGGEDAFSDLARWMKTEDDSSVALLSFYELILSLGWQGRYRVLDRGDVLLRDLRSQLHVLIWRHVPPEPLGTKLITLARPHQRWWTVARAGAVALAAVLLIYGIISAVLNSQGAPIRNALAAWMPPTRTINLAETLPPPLPLLLSEGWLTAYKHPEGWLLVFRSDGAFDVGKAKVRADFEGNIERLGLAFAPWPGDLEVIGHTDRQPIRTSEFANNQVLSEARARTVANELRRTALPGGAQAPENAVQRNIGFSGLGDTQPMDPARTSAAYEKNRRVDVLWKVIPGGGRRTERNAAATTPYHDTNAMPDGVEMTPEGQSPYATQKVKPW